MKRERFVVKYGKYLEFKKANNISHFYADDKTVYLVDNENKRFTIDFTLSELEGELNSSNFFRINRKVIVNLDSIKRIKVLPNRKLHLMLNIPSQEKIEVSRDRVSSFKQWIEA